jgi:hypothetical protein
VVINNKVMPPKSTPPLVTVAVYLYGFELDPVHISLALGVQPSASQVKGATQARFASHTAKTGMWCLIVESDSRPVSEMINELLQKLNAPPRPLDSLGGVQHAHLQILFAFEESSSRPTVELVLTSEQITNLSQLGLSACITVM